MLLALVSFFIALFILVSVHEWGHYQMARFFGVRVEKFSIGFGKLLLKYQPKNSHTEFSLRLIPLGGFVKMLGDDEKDVPPELQKESFLHQSVYRRFLIVLAGPVANLVLALLIFFGQSLIGAKSFAPILSTPAHESLAMEAGVQSGDIVKYIHIDGHQHDISNMNVLMTKLQNAIFDKKDVELNVVRNGQIISYNLPVSKLATDKIDEKTIEKLGIVRPYSIPLIKEVTSGTPAEKAGVKADDLVVEIDGRKIADSSDLIEEINSIEKYGPESKWQEWKVNRNGSEVLLRVKPEVKKDNKGEWDAKAGIQIQSGELIPVKYTFTESITNSFHKLWEVSSMSLKMLYRIITGKMSIESLSGPVAMADYAGQAASIGLTTFIATVAFFSISLGIINLLPIPTLDGGHLMFYTIEIIRRRPVSKVWQMRFQAIGFAFLVATSITTIFNDVMARL